MIPFTELYLKKLITENLNYIKTNSDIIDRMFSLVDSKSSAKFKKFIKDSSIKTIIGYPRAEHSTLPCICIMLGGEDEEVNVLGDVEEDAIFFDDIDSEEKTEMIYGTFMNSSFRLECWSDNSELTLFIYYLLKYIIIRNRAKIISDSEMQLPKLSGGDLEPLPDYFPTFIFRRALVLNGKVDNALSSRDYEVFESIENVIIHGEMVE